MNIFGHSIGNESKFDRNRRINKEIKIWNEAIEIAAIKLSYYCNDLRIIDEIRKLKKDVTY